MANWDFREKHQIKELLKTISRQAADRLIESALDDTLVLENIFQTALGNESPYAWRAAWVLVHLHKACPEALDAYENRMIQAVPNLETDRQQISFLQILADRDFDTDEAGELFDIAAQNIIAAGKQMYIRQRSLLFLEQFVIKVPDLSGELQDLIEGENNLPGNHSVKLALKRIRKTLQKLENNIV